MASFILQQVSRVRKHPRFPRGWRSVFALTFVLPLTACTQGAPTDAEKTSETSTVTEKAVHFVSGNTTLAGTLSFPAGPHSHPAVVLFHGSGSQNRDSQRWLTTNGAWANPPETSARSHSWSFATTA